MLQDTCCSIVPYFQINPGQVAAFKQLGERFVAASRQEEKCLYYGFSFHEDIAHCREGYQDAEGVLTHLANVKPLLEEALTLSMLLKLEIHGPAGELDKLRDPLAELPIEFFTLEMGFRN